MEVRPVYDYDSHGVRFDTGEREEVVVIFLPDGTRYEVAVDDGSGDVRITSLLVRPAPGGEADHAALRQIPLRTLAEVAAGHLDEFHSHREEGLPTFAAAIEASAVGEEEPRRRGSRPDLRAFAAQWKATRSRTLTEDGRVLPKRKALAEHYGVKEATIDLWTRLARDVELLPHTRMGRPRNDITDPANHPDE